MLRSLIFLIALSLPAGADTAQFDIRLAGARLGQITVSDTGAGTDLSTLMDNTPLGVGDGRFDASFASDAYRSLGQSPGESRRIDMDFDGGAVVRVDITPQSEATDASDPASVPAGVLDPARGFARIALSRDCVGAFRMYDGRRVVTVRPSDRELSADRLRCRYDYRVTGGPGHLSPFRFRKVTMDAQFAVSDGRVRSLVDIALRAGPFTVRLVRQ